ncbi:hypothetical protein Trydic_g22169 [Trypoxylus dichotomus]
MEKAVDEFEVFQQNMRSSDESKSTSEGIAGIKEIAPNSNSLDALMQHIIKKDMLLERLIDNARFVIPDLFSKIPNFVGEPTKAKS